MKKRKNYFPTSNLLFVIKAVALIRLPTNPDLKKWKDHERLLVGMVPAEYSGKAQGVHDVILEEADGETVERFVGLGKRMIIHEADSGNLDKKKLDSVWGLLKKG